jgi:Tubulin domain
MQSWDFGLELFEKEDKEHDLLDRDFRYFAEECDQMQGVVIMAGTEDAWGGYAKGYIERLRDELGKGVLWVWGLNRTSGSNDITSVGGLDPWFDVAYNPYRDGGQRD